MVLLYKITSAFSETMASHVPHASFIYLDDGISGHNCRTDASAASIQNNDLSLSGFKTNDEKCHWQPMQIGEWLGMIINTVKFQFQISPWKIEKIKKNIAYVLASNCASYQQLAKIAGFINSLYLAVGPPVRLLSRQLFFLISQRDSWSGHLDCIPPLN